MKWRYKKRILETKKINAHDRIIVLTGARQTGKTTFVKNFYKEYKYISIEDPVLRSQYSSLTASQWNNLYPTAILDEVQKVPILIESIKAVYDQFPETRYILLGSSQLLLMQKVKESLAGRCKIIEMYPLVLPEIISKSWEDKQKPSLLETLIIKGKLPGLHPSFQLYADFAQRQQAYEHYLLLGGYPALVDANMTDDERYDWLYNYVRTYLERDIRDLAEFRNLEPFIKAQKVSAALSGQLVNFSVIAKEAGISPKTAQKFIHYLELSYQVIMLQPWHKNPLKRLNKSPKIHYLDPGIQKTVIGKKGNLSGNEFESAIVAEIYKQCKNIEFRGDFYHLRTVDGREIDLLLETENGYYAFEIKQSTNISTTDFRHFKGLGELLDKQLLGCFVLSNDNKVLQISESMYALPAAMFLT
jgi:uncharacterized protein